MNSAFLEKAAFQAAFIAISTRIVGSAFRCLETLNPNYQQSQVISNPRSVCIRELSTICMAFAFSLITHSILQPKALARGWSKFTIQFLTSVIGTTIAESMGRLIAYRRKTSPCKRHLNASICLPTDSPSITSMRCSPLIPIQQNKKVYTGTAYYSPYSYYKAPRLK